MKVWVVKEYENYGDDVTECLVRVYSTEDKAKEDLIKIYNDFLYNADDSEEELIKYEWEHNNWVADGLGTVWALMSDMTIDDGTSF